MHEFKHKGDAQNNVWTLNEFEIPDNYMLYSIVFEGSNPLVMVNPVSISKKSFFILNVKNDTHQAKTFF